MNNDVDVSALINKSNEKLITAKIDFDNQRYEDSISRCYYAVYHIITACLFLKGLTFSSHSKTIGAFNKEFIKTGIFKKEFTSIIQNLFEDRQSGDYDVFFKADRDLAQMHYENAGKIIEEVTNFIKK